MKKLLIVGLLLLGVTLFVTDGLAADNVRSAEFAGYGAKSIADASSGACLEVDTAGRAYTREMGGHTISTGYGDRLVYTGSCVVHRVILQGHADNAYAAIYDRVTAGDKSTVKLDPQDTTGDKTESVDAGGALFSTGIYIDAYDANTLVTVIYDAI